MTTSDRSADQQRPARDTARFGQLTYTSYSDVSAPYTPGPTGWHAKEQTPDITEDERSTLVGWVSTHLDPVTPIPPFPTAQDIADLPRRLLYARLDDRQAIYCHTVPAGNDAAGRPGNVFSHVLLDREADANTGVRPIELWGSPDWLTPFGQEKISAATLGQTRQHLRPGRSVDRSAVLEYLLGRETWRIGTMRVLLDAVDRCLRGGPHIVLAVDGTDTAALWIGAVSYFMSGASARSLNWTTFDRADSVASAIRRGLHIVAVPVQDSAVVEDSAQVVVLDTTQAMQPGELGRSDHRTHRGTAVPVREWSVLAETVLLDYETAERAMSAIDDVAARVPGTQLSPGWPLAMVVAGSPRLRDAQDEARRIIARDSPASLHEVPALLRSVADVLLPGLGHNAADAWAELTQTTPGVATDGVTQDLVWKTFVSRALRDPDWLGREQRSYDRVFAPAHGQGPSDLIGEAHDAVRALAERAEEADPDSAAAAHVARTALRMIELLDHAGLTGGVIDDLVHHILDKTLKHRLYDQVLGTEFVREIGPVTERVRTDFVLPSVVTEKPVEDRPLGRRFTREVARWLQGAGAADFESLRRDPRLIETPVYQVLSDAVFRIFTTGSALEQQKWAEIAPIGLWRALYEERSDQRWRPTDITPLFTGERWDTDKLLLVDSYLPTMIPPRFFRQALIESATAGDVESIAARITSGGHSKAREAVTLTGTPSDSAGDQLAETWAKLATMEWRALRPSDIESFRPVLTDYDRRTASSLPAPLSVNLAIAYILLRSKEFETSSPPSMSLGPAHESTLAYSAATNRETTVNALVILVDHNCLDAYWVCAIAVLAAQSAPPTKILPPNDPLRLMRDTGGRTIFEDLAMRLMRFPFFWAAPACEADLVEAVRTLSASVSAAESPWTLDGLDRFARTWLNANRQPQQ